MNQALLRYEWNTIPWPEVEGSVFKLQKRIYRASLRGDIKRLHRLQRLLLKSTSAKLLAVKRVTQDNQGKKTAGVDGIAHLNPAERLHVVETLKLDHKSQPVRRIWIPKPGKTEKRPLGIPTLRDRAKQALAKLALEPEWEARFEPNNYGFRPGRSCHDAIEAIFGAIKNKQAFVLDADISGCFDNISHSALLEKLHTMPTLRRVIKAWLRAGVLEGTVFHTTQRGTPQGGVISPLLANVALHGLEWETKQALAQQLYQYRKEKQGKASHTAAQKQISLIRYADDFVVLCESEAIIRQAKAFIEAWLKGIGLELKPPKTRITHTMHYREGLPPGFDFLGFQVRQFRTKDNKLGYKLITKPSREGIKRHAEGIRQLLRRMRGATQEAVIRQLNPIIKGWSRYYTTGVSRKTFEWLDNQMHQKLWRWARYRHPHKGEQWTKRKYFRTQGGDNWRFMTPTGKLLIRHADHAICRHVKVRDTKSPYDGDGVYWATRLGRTPGLSPRVAKLLKAQQGACGHCRKGFRADDRMEVHHRDQDPTNTRFNTLMLVHRHCHDDIHGQGVYVKRQATEEPDESKRFTSGSEAKW